MGRGFPLLLLLLLLLLLSCLLGRATCWLTPTARCLGCPCRPPRSRQCGLLLVEGGGACCQQGVALAGELLHHLGSILHQHQVDPGVLCFRLSAGCGWVGWREAGGGGRNA
jgi:hypothetical protein